MSETASAGASHTTRDATKLSIALHVLALATLLGAGSWIVRTGDLFFVDEGAVVTQARAIADGAWRVEHPAPEVDPDGRWFPVQHSEVIDGGAAAVPYAKHPLYPAVLSRLDSVGGVPAMAGLSIAGGVATAAAAFWLALTVGLGQRVALGVLWVVGLGTPLLFDSYLVVAHTPAAALVTLSLVAALRALDSRKALGWILLAAVAVALAALLRTEVVLFGAAACVAFLMSSANRARRLAVAGALVTGAGAAYLLDGWLHQIVIGESGAVPFVIAQDSRWFIDRLESFFTTLVRPGHPDQASSVALLLGLMTACLTGLVALGARRASTTENVALMMLSVASVVAGLLAAIIAPSVLIPGLFAACPALLWVLVWSQDLWRAGGHVRTLLTAMVLFIVAVVLIQYGSGGGPQWGGRYFAVIVPTMVVLGAVVARLALARLEPTTFKVIALCLLLVTLVGSARSMAALRDAREVNATALESIADGVTDVAEAADPLVISTSFVPPRLGADLLERFRWLFVPVDELDEAVSAAAGAGESEVVIVSDEMLPIDGAAERIESGELVEPFAGWIVQRLCLDSRDPTRTCVRRVVRLR